MKKSILTLVFALTTLFANAQQRQDIKAEYKKAITELLQHAKNDFKDITGEKVEENDGLIFKYCTHNSDLGKVGYIVKDMQKNGATNWFFTTEDNNIIRGLTEIIDEYVKEKFPEPDYTIWIDGADEDEDYWEETTVFSYISADTIENRKQFLKYFTETDPQTKTPFFRLEIYGVSAQKIK